MSREALSRRQRVANEGEARVTQCSLAFPSQYENVNAHSRRNEQQQPEHLGPQKRHGLSTRNDRRGQRAVSFPSTSTRFFASSMNRMEVLGQAAARRKLAAALAKVGEAQDRVDQIVVSGE